MKSFVRLSILSACLFVTFATFAIADEYNQSSEIALEIRNLTEAVNRLTTLMDDQKKMREDDVRFRKLDLAIAYLNFRSRRIESIERDIESQRSIQSRLEENLPRLTERINDLEELMQDYPQGAPQEIVDAHKDIIYQSRMIRDRISRINDDIVMKENLLYELQSQISDIESYVQRHLQM